jgi:hypothetical protein
MMLAPFALAGLLAWLAHPGALLALGALPHAIALVRGLGPATEGAALNALLAGTARQQLLFSALLAAGVSL